jgi:hypothetical protein
MPSRECEAVERVTRGRGSHRDVTARNSDIRASTFAPKEVNMAINSIASPVEKAAAQPHARKQSPASAQPVMEETAQRSTISADERERMIRDAAYSRYQQGGCVDGRDVEDWLAAEAEIDARLIAELRVQ